MKSGLTTHEIREWFNWTQEEMAINWSIPIATIKNWDARQCMPIYVREMALEIRKSWDMIAERDRHISNLITKR